MSYQKFHFIRSNQPTILIAIFFIFLIFSCNQNDDKKNPASIAQQDSRQVASNDTTKKSAVPSTTDAVVLTSVRMPVFRIEKDDLRNSFRSNDRIIIKLNLIDFSDYSKIELCVYPAASQSQHGTDLDPIPNTVIEGNPTNIDAPILIGNNYIKLRKILKINSIKFRDFTYLKLIPTIVTINNKKHLAFDLVAVKEENQLILTEVNLGKTNPSPPADPSLEP